uniref:Uncharacterized protein n=1 Tax=Caudovirales sp. ctkvU4 TaxID=2826783 RepID=A0A8S5QQG8_9CAUD|nr:MAG TPA: hypothetical protein [Caudovirales sp. ctkvU4]
MLFCLQNKNRRYFLEVTDITGLSRPRIFQLQILKLRLRSPWILQNLFFSIIRGRAKAKSQIAKFAGMGISLCKMIN